MANYVCTNRTNYFRVTDAEAFKNFLSQVVTDTDEDLYVLEKETDDETYYAFGCYSNIFGIPDDTGETDVDSYDRFIDGLQKYVAKDDAVILLHVGHEKLRYVTGCATVITKKSMDIINIQDLAVKLAQEKLGKPEYKPGCDY